MAQIVAGIACSHVPLMASEENWRRLREPERENLRSGFRRARQLLEESHPDVLITFADDHFDRCFYDNLPAFLIGVGDEAAGPAIAGFDLPQVRVPTLVMHARNEARVPFELVIVDAVHAVRGAENRHRAGIGPVAVGGAGAGALVADRACRGPRVAADIVEPAEARLLVARAGKREALTILAGMALWHTAGVVAGDEGHV